MYTVLGQTFGWSSCQEEQWLRSNRWNQSEFPQHLNNDKTAPLATVCRLVQTDVSVPDPSTMADSQPKNMEGHGFSRLSELGKPIFRNKSTQLRYEKEWIQSLLRILRSQTGIGFRIITVIPIGSEKTRYVCDRTWTLLIKKLLRESWEANTFKRCKTW